MIQEPSLRQKEEAEKLIKQSSELWGTDKQIALNCIEEATKLSPNNEEYLCMQGDLLYHLSRFEDSIQSCNKSIQIKPTVEAYCVKADSLFKLNQLKEAITCLEQGLTQFTNDYYLIRRLNYYESFLN